MRTVILDLETVPDPELPFEPPADRPDAFPPPPHHQIVAFGVMCWGSDGPVRHQCLGKRVDDHDGDVVTFEEVDALRDFAQLLRPGTQIVTWNGLRFDLPVIVARCMKHRVALPEYYRGRGYRYRFSDDGHLDLRDHLSDFDARGTAGLDTWAKLIGLPGKGDVNGSKVAELWAAGEHSLVRRYCLDDVAQTARLWLEWRHLTGSLRTEVLDQEVAKLDACVAALDEPQELAADG